MEMDTSSETLDTNYTLIQLIARDYISIVASYHHHHHHHHGALDLMTGFISTSL
jgi:hypothetical protein